jgi:hypothetical protein
MFVRNYFVINFFVSEKYVDSNKIELYNYIIINFFVGKRTDLCFIKKIYQFIPTYQYNTKRYTILHRIISIKNNQTNHRIKIELLLYIQTQKQRPNTRHG